MAKAAAGATGKLAACDEGWGGKAPRAVKRIFEGNGIRR